MANFPVSTASWLFVDPTWLIIASQGVKQIAPDYQLSRVPRDETREARADVDEWLAKRRASCDFTDSSFTLALLSDMFGKHERPA
jgi:hypothetical protein